MARKQVATEDDSDIEPSKETELAKPGEGKPEIAEEETEGLETEAKTPGTQGSWN